MTPEQALDILENATKNIPGTRDQHLVMTEAARVLRAAIGTTVPETPAESAEPPA